MELFLHLGAHKTASTHLQNSLRDHAEALRETGVVYVDLVAFRQRLSPLLWKMQHGDDPDQARAEARQVISGWAGDAGRLILSDENLLDHPLKAAAVNRFYPDCEKSLRSFIQLFDRPPARLFLATRSLDTFLASSYVERLRHHWVPGFEAFLGSSDPVLLSWARLTARIRETLGHPDTVVWRYEDYRAVGARVVREMAGIDVPLSDSIIRPGLSGRGVGEVERAGRQGRDIVAERLVDQMANDYPKGADWPEFDPWEPALRERLRQRYQDDVARLREMDGVRLIEP